MYVSLYLFECVFLLRVKLEKRPLFLSLSWYFCNDVQALKYHKNFTDMSVVTAWNASHDSIIFLRKVTMSLCPLSAPIVYLFLFFCFFSWLSFICGVFFKLILIHHWNSVHTIWTKYRKTIFHWFSIINFKFAGETPAGGEHNLV